MQIEKKKRCVPNKFFLCVCGYFSIFVLWKYQPIYILFIYKMDIYPVFFGVIVLHWIILGECIVIRSFLINRVCPLSRLKIDVQEMIQVDYVTAGI